MKRLICVFFTTTTFFFFAVNAYNHSSGDIKDLEELFYELVVDNDFGYTLFFDKPVSLSRDSTLTPWENTLEGFKFSGIFWRKWKIWEKYKSHYYSNFILKKERSPFPNSLTIIFINKLAFAKTIETYRKRFEKILQKEIDIPSLIAGLESNKLELTDFIQNNQFLWGILLGYGECNAMLYSQMGKIVDHSRLSYFHGDNCVLTRIHSLQFRAKLSHKETENLKEKYQKQQASLNVLFAKGNFFQTVFQKLSEK